LAQAILAQWIDGPKSAVATSGAMVSICRDYRPAPAATSVAAAPTDVKQQWNQWMVPGRSQAPMELVGGVVSQVPGQIQQAITQGPMAAHAQQWNQWMAADRDRPPAEYIKEWVSSNVASGYELTKQYAPVAKDWVATSAMASYDLTRQYAPVAKAWVQQQAATGYDMTKEYVPIAKDWIQQQAMVATQRVSPPTNTASGMAPAQPGWGAWLPTAARALPTTTTLPEAMPPPSTVVPLPSATVPAPLSSLVPVLSPGPSARTIIQQAPGVSPLFPATSGLVPMPTNSATLATATPSQTPSAQTLALPLAAATPLQTPSSQASALPHAAATPSQTPSQASGLPHGTSNGAFASGPLPLPSPASASPPSRLQSQASYLQIVEPPLSASNCNSPVDYNVGGPPVASLAEVASTHTPSAKKRGKSVDGGRNTRDRNQKCKCCF